MSSIFELAGVPKPTTDDAKIRFIADQIRNAKRDPDNVPVPKEIFLRKILWDLQDLSEYIYDIPIYYQISAYIDIDVGECVLPPGKNGSGISPPRDDFWDGTEFERLYGGTEIPL